MDERVLRDGQTSETEQNVEEPVVVLRHPGQWLATATLLVLAAMFINFVATNERLRLDIFAQFVFDPSVIAGLVTTLQLTALGMVLGTVLGMLLAIMRLSGNPILRLVSFGYVWVFRSIPLLVQLLFWFFLGSILPRISLGIPFGPEFVSFDANDLISKFTAAILGLALFEAAYMAEIMRAGISSIDPGQTEAAQALGMNDMKLYRRVIIPQAARVIVPPAGNQVIALLKYTAIVLVIGIPDLLTTVQSIYSRNFQQIPLLLVATFWYFIVTSVLTVIQMQLEKRMSRGFAGNAASVAKQGQG